MDVMAGRCVGRLDLKMNTREDPRRVTPEEASEASLLPHVRLSDTDRLEAFSDGVLSITLTLLVVEIVRPDYAPGLLLAKLAAQWASYIAFLASFCYELAYSRENRSSVSVASYWTAACTLPICFCCSPRR